MIYKIEGPRRSARVFGDGRAPEPLPKVPDRWIETEDEPEIGLYDFQTADYIYGEPIGDPLDPSHPRDRDGFLIRKRYKIKAWIQP